MWFGKCNSDSVIEIESRITLHVSQSSDDFDEFRSFYTRTNRVVVFSIEKENQIEKKTTKFHINEASISKYHRCL